MSKQIVEIRTQTGQPVVFNGFTVTPRSQALIIRAPFIAGGVIWNRPLSITVESAGAPSRTIPVWDITRLGQLALLGAGFIGSILIWRFVHGRI